MEEVSVLLDLIKKKERQNRVSYWIAVVFIVIGLSGIFLPYLDRIGQIDYGMFLFILGVVTLGSIQRTKKDVSNEKELLMSLERRLPKM
jgi:hypothetical protein